MTTPNRNGDVHHCDAWPTAEEQSGIYPNPCSIERSGGGSWSIDAGTGEYGWTIRFCPFCGIELGKECALCGYRHRMPDRAPGCDCECHTESPTGAEQRSVDSASAEVAQQSSAKNKESPLAIGAEYRILVDELRIWPHAKRPFLEGSCHLTVERVGDRAERRSTDEAEVAEQASAKETADDKAIEALHAFAAKIGLRRAWFQADGSCSHYDLTPGRRTRAIAAGAVFVPARDQAIARRALREKKP